MRCAVFGHHVQTLSGKSWYAQRGLVHFVFLLWAAASSTTAACDMNQFQASPLVVGCDEKRETVPLDLKKMQSTHLVSLPAGVPNVQITLEAAVDLDLNLLDSQSGECIVGFDCMHSNSCSDENDYCITWAGMNIYFSGDDSAAPVTETIRIQGSLRAPMSLQVKAFGTGVGTATFSHGALPECPEVIPGCKLCSEYPQCNPTEFITRECCDADEAPQCDGKRAAEVVCLPPTTTTSTVTLTSETITTTTTSMSATSTTETSTTTTTTSSVTRTTVTTTTTRTQSTTTKSATTLSSTVTTASSTATLTTTSMTLTSVTPTETSTATMATTETQTTTRTHSVTTTTVTTMTTTVTRTGTRTDTTITTTTITRTLSTTSSSTGTASSSTITRTVSLTPTFTSTISTSTATTSATTTSRTATSTITSTSTTTKTSSTSTTTLTASSTTTTSQTSATTSTLTTSTSSTLSTTVSTQTTSTTTTSSTTTSVSTTTSTTTVTTSTTTTTCGCCFSCPAATCLAAASSGSDGIPVRTDTRTVTTISTTATMTSARNAFATTEELTEVSLVGEVGEWYYADLVRQRFARFLQRSGLTVSIMDSIDKEQLLLRVSMNHTGDLLCGVMTNYTRTGTDFLGMGATQSVPGEKLSWILIISLIAAGAVILLAALMLTLLWRRERRWLLKRRDEIIADNKSIAARESMVTQLENRIEASGRDLLQCALSTSFLGSPGLVKLRTEAEPEFPVPMSMASRAPQRKSLTIGSHSGDKSSLPQWAADHPLQTVQKVFEAARLRLESELAEGEDLRGQVRVLQEQLSQKDRDLEARMAQREDIEKINFALQSPSSSVSTPLASRALRVALKDFGALGTPDNDAVEALVTMIMNLENPVSEVSQLCEAAEAARSKLEDVLEARQSKHDDIVIGLRQVIKVQESRLATIQQELEVTKTAGARQQRQAEYYKNLTDSLYQEIRDRETELQSRSGMSLRAIADVDASIRATAYR